MRVSCRLAYSLAEIIVALGILALAILSMVGVFTYVFRLQNKSHQLAIASELGRDFLERVKRNGFAQISNGNYDGRSPTPRNPMTGFPPEPYPGKNIEGNDYRLRVFATNFSTRVRSVQVEIFWDRNSRMVFKTMIHE